MAGLIALLIIWSFVISLRVYEDNYLWKRCVKINHEKNAATVVVISTILDLIYTYVYVGGDIYLYIYVEFMLCSSYWLLFDMFIGFSMGLGLQYIGETAKLDILLSKYSYKQPIIFKLILMSIVSLVYHSGLVQKLFNYLILKFV